jgi:hypothetical protein
MKIFEHPESDIVKLMDPRGRISRETSIRWLPATELRGSEINDVPRAFSRTAPTFGCGRKAKNDIFENLLKEGGQGRVILVALPGDPSPATAYPLRIR